MTMLSRSIWILLLCLQRQLVAAALEEDELYWSYGRVPPVYPTPPTIGLNAWNQAYVCVRGDVSRMSLEEKQNVTIGISPSPNGCVGFSGGAQSVKFPGLCLQDGPTGVRATDFVSSFPAELHIGASWNVDLAEEIAEHMGKECRQKGVNVALGPVAGPLGRVALGGRNWEGFSNDPYLSGRMNAVTVHGMQKNVIACVKHLIGNEQETFRRRSTDELTEGVSSNIDDRTMHELYLWGTSPGNSAYCTNANLAAPFQDAVRTGVGSVMCAYNKVNNSYACQNSKLINGLLKTELGFQGFVVSDWRAQHGGLAAATSGLDMMVPDAGLWKSNALVEAVKNETLTTARLDDMVTRILASYYLLGMDSHYPVPGIGLSKFLTLPHAKVDARDPSSRRATLQSAVEGHVLVKNVDTTLPFESPMLLSLFGFDGPAPRINNPSGVSPSRWFIGGISVDISDISFLQAVGTGTTPQVAALGTLTSGGGSGAGTGPYVNSPFSAFDQKAYEDGFALHWDFENENPDVNPISDACIVFINEFSAEAFDRPGLADGRADNMVRNVASKCESTIVVIHNAGIRLVDNWVDHPNIKAVIYAHLPGQDAGRSLVEIMFGKQSPSGRMPYTVAKKVEDYGALLGPSLAGDPSSRSYRFPQSNFDETLYIDYRHFIKNKVEPRYAFGFGLTYTTFEYADLEVNMDVENPPVLPPDSAIAEGGLSSLFDIVATVTFKVANTGDVAAAEVAQLYVGAANGNGSSKQLRGFAKRLIQPGATESIELKLTRRDLSIWDVEKQQWALQRGDHDIYVGASVLDTPLHSQLKF